MIKSYLRQIIERHPFLAYWVASVHSKVFGLLAWRYRIAQIGYAHVALSARITGWSSCKFERNVVIGARTWINVNNRVKSQPSVVIGENTFIGQDNFMTSGNHINIGPYCLTGARCSFIGSTHVVDDPMRVYSTTGTTHSDEIWIGSNTFFGYGVMVLGNVSIGHGCIIGAGAVVRNDIPPFSVAVGNPARVVSYYDFEQKKWTKGLRPAYENSSFPNEAEYTRTIKKNCHSIMQPMSAAASFLSDI